MKYECPPCIRGKERDIDASPEKKRLKMDNINQKKEERVIRRDKLHTWNGDEKRKQTKPNDTLRIVNRNSTHTEGKEEEKEENEKKKDKEENGEENKKEEKEKENRNQKKRKAGRPKVKTYQKNTPEKKKCTKGRKMYPNRCNKNEEWKI